MTWSISHRRMIAPRLALLCATMATTGSVAWAETLGPAAVVARANFPAIGTIVPIHTKIRIRLERGVSSATSKTGQNFGFVVLDPIIVDGQVVAKRGAHGSGLIALAGHSGTGGHEGDLTLHLDTIDTVNGRILACDEKLEINGHRQALLSSVLGFVPIAGPAATLIQGSDRTLRPGEVLDIRFTHTARVVASAEEADAAHEEMPAGTSGASAAAGARADGTDAPPSAADEVRAKPREAAADTEAADEPAALAPVMPATAVIAPAKPTKRPAETRDSAFWSE